MGDTTKLIRSILFSLALLSFLVTPDISMRAAEIAENYSMMTFRYNSAGSNYRDFGFDFIMRRKTSDGRWRISHKVIPVSWVKQDTSFTVFSMQGPIFVAIHIFANSVTPSDQSVFEYSRSIWYKVITFPASQYDYAISRSSFIGLSNNSEYIFYRGHTGERGISYTPAITYSFWGYPNGESWDIASLRVRLGHTVFWNFDGPDRLEGFTIGFEASFGSGEY